MFPILPKKPSMITVALALIAVGSGIDVLQIVHHLASNPINLLETFTNKFVLGGAIGGALLGAVIALLWHLSPKASNSIKLWCIGLFVPLCTTMYMLRLYLDLSWNPLSIVLSLLGINLMIRAVSPFYKNTPKDRS